MDSIGNLRKTFDLKQIISGLESLHNKTVLMACKEIPEIFKGVLSLNKDLVKITLTDKAMSSLLNLMSDLKSSTVFYFFDDDKSFVMKIAAYNFIFEKKDILFNSPRNALLPERRKEPRRTVLNTFGFLVHNKQRYKFTFIDYNENGCRIKIHKNLLPDINLKNHLDYSLSFKNHTREYLCDLITITDKDNYFYIGIQFLESVYERINLLPAHLEFN